MISDEPQFMASLSKLNTTILKEAVDLQIIPKGEMTNRKQKFEETRDRLIDTTSKGRQDRLRETLGFDARAAAGTPEEEQVGVYDLFLSSWINTRICVYIFVFVFKKKQH